MCELGVCFEHMSDWVVVVVVAPSYSLVLHVRFTGSCDGGARFSSLRLQSNCECEWTYVFGAVRVVIMCMSSVPMSRFWALYALTKRRSLDLRRSLLIRRNAIDCKPSIDRLRRILAWNLCSCWWRFIEWHMCGRGILDISTSIYSKWEWFTHDDYSILCHESLVDNFTRILSKSNIINSPISWVNRITYVRISVLDTLWLV